MLAGIIYGNEFRRKFYGFLKCRVKDYIIMEIYSCDDVFEKKIAIESFNCGSCYAKYS